ncbi:MAG: TlpA family protein disulfide reductase [Candidatus Competibacter sp.]|nr:TlpA family protein disulfide reductase [Candidatus Competibacter sp.]
MTLFRFLPAALLLALAACDSDLPALRSGTTAPAFTLDRLDGAPARYPHEYANRVVAIRFWADWCPSCRGEMTGLEPVYRRYREQGLTVLAINVLQAPEQVRPFVKELGISYEVLLDRQGEVTRQYQVMALPVTYIIDRQGVIRGRIVGEATAEAFVKEIAGLL